MSNKLKVHSLSLKILKIDGVMKI